MKNYADLLGWPTPSRRQLKHKTQQKFNILKSWAKRNIIISTRIKLLRIIWIALFKLLSLDEWQRETWRGHGGKLFWWSIIWYDCSGWRYCVEYSFLNHARIYRNLRKYVNFSNVVIFRLIMTEPVERHAFDKTITFLCGGLCNWMWWINFCWSVSLLVKLERPTDYLYPKQFHQERFS